MEQENPEDKKCCRPNKNVLFNQKVTGMFYLYPHCIQWLFICRHEHGHSQHQH